MNIHKNIKSLKRNAILLLLYDLLVLCIAFAKNGMTNMSAEALTSLIVSLVLGIFINLLWILVPKPGLQIVENENTCGHIGVAKLHFCC